MRNRSVQFEDDLAQQIEDRMWKERVSFSAWIRDAAIAMLQLPQRTFIVKKHGKLRNPHKPMGNSPSEPPEGLSKDK